MEKIQAVRGSDPQVASRAAGQREDDIAGQAVGGGDVGEAGAGAAIQPGPVGADPQLPVAALKYAAHQVAGETIAGGVSGEYLIAQEVQSVAIGAQPQVAFVVFVQRQYAIAGHRGNRGKGLKLVSRQPGDPPLAGDPKHPLAVLKEMIHAADVRSLGPGSQPGSVRRQVDDAGGRAQPHTAGSISREGGDLGFAREIWDRDGRDRAGGIVFQPLFGADPEGGIEGMRAVELHGFHFDAAQEATRQPGYRGTNIQRQDAAAAPQPKRSLVVLRQTTARERPRGLGSGDLGKAFSIEEGRPGRSDGP